MTSHHHYQHLARQLCALNNQGVHSLESNAPEKALAHFVKSLLIGKDLSRNSHQKCAPDSSRDSLSCSRSASQSDENETTLFVYRTALGLPEKCCSPDETSIRLYSAVVIFNLALAHHQVGMKTGKSSPLAQAEKLYQTSIQILQDLNPLSFNETTLLIVIASHNNLAHIDMEKGMIAIVNSRIKYLSGVLRQSRIKQRGVFTGDELNGIFSNIFLLMGGGLAASPAA